MRKIAGAELRALALLVGAALFAAAAPAQHGHPLVGSWSGDWAPEGGREQRILLVLDYHADDTLSGEIFFGTTRVPLARATLDSASWTLRLEAAEYVLEGRIENLGSVTERSISGTLSGNGQRGPFRVVMN